MTQDTEGRLSPWLAKQRIRVALPWLTGRVLDFGCGSGALAEHIPSDRYLGVDINPKALTVARRSHPAHRFAASSSGGFGTVAALAVVEHLEDPGGWMTEMMGIADRVVVTTPNPRLEMIHGAGAAVGLFSREAHDEHVSVMGRRGLGRLGVLVHYRRFLFGANQLAVFGQ
jgi:SAM-dependent methyltransferase